MIIFSPLVGCVGRKVVVRVWFGDGLSGFWWSWAVYFSLALLHNTNSRFESFAFRFSIRFTFCLLSFSAILAAFSCPNMV